MRRKRRPGGYIDMKEDIETRSRILRTTNIENLSRGLTTRWFKEKKGRKIRQGVDEKMKFRTRA